MHTAPPTDLEILLRRHLPDDTDPAITDQVVDQWKAGLQAATCVIVQRVESYGPKLQASWLEREGQVVASIARPLVREEYVRAFVRDWEHYMTKRGLRPTVIWNDGAGPESNGAATGW